MVTNTIQPEFCYSNFINLNANPNFTITLDSYWYNNPEYLYDNFQGDIYNNAYRKVLFTSESNDTITNTIIVDFQDEQVIDTVKLLNTNIKTGSIAISNDGVSYTTVYSITNNTAPCIHWNVTDSTFSAYENPYLGTETSEILSTEDYVLLIAEWVISTRFVKISFETTQNANYDKYIGELYIGRRAFKLDSGKLISYSFDIEDPKRDEMKTYNGYYLSIRNTNVYKGDLVFRNISLAEYNFLRTFQLNGGYFNFFPGAGDSDREIDYSINSSEIYYVTTSGNFNRNAWGSNADGTLTINLRETVYVS